MKSDVKYQSDVILSLNDVQFVFKTYVTVGLQTFLELRS